MDGKHATRPNSEGPTPEGTQREEARELTQRSLDRYVLRHELGTGAMGSVWAAYDPKLMREVAVKVVATQQQDNDKGRARFVREARAIAAIHHPNVVQIFDYSGLDSHTLYLVMEKLDGQDLWSLMHAHQAQPEAIAAAIGHELCAALEQAHAVGIIHRDLKPENVFLTDGGRVVLTDFGIVKAIADDAAVEGFAERTEVIGTPGFMAPELMRGKALTPSTDIFALGALLYNIATLKMPFEGTSPVAMFQAAQRGDFVDPRQYQPNLSPEFCAVIAACLQFAPKKRPRSAAAVRMMLRNVLDGLGVSEMRDDLHSFMADAQALTELSHRRVLRTTLNRLKVAVADGSAEAAQKLAARARQLDPFNQEVERILASAPVRVSAQAGSQRLSPMAGVTHLLSGTDWLFGGANKLAGRVTLPNTPKQATSRLLRAAPGRPSAFPGSFAAMLMASAVALGGVGLLLVAHQTRATSHVEAVEMSAQAATQAENYGHSHGGHGATSIVERSAAASGDALQTYAAHGGQAPSFAEADAPVRSQNLPASEAAATPRPGDHADQENQEAQTPTAELEGPEGSDVDGLADATAESPATTAWLDLAVAASGRGAWLRIDGHNVGWVHVTRMELAPGRHLLELAARGGHRLRRVLTLLPGDERAVHVDFSKRLLSAR